MAEQRKYMFDVDFTPGSAKPSAESRGDGGDVGMVEPPPPPPPPAPTFSEEELSLARETAFEEGRRIGFSEGQDAGGKQIAEAVAALTDALPSLSQAQVAANDRILSDAVKLVMATMRRALPAMAEKGGFDEVSKVVAELVPHLLDEPRIIVRVAKSLVDTMRERLEQVAASTGFEGRVVVQDDERLGPGDCKVEWADGGAERDLSRLIGEMNQIVDRALASVPVHTDRTTQAEDTALKET